MEGRKKGMRSEIVALSNYQHSNLEATLKGDSDLPFINCLIDQ